MNNLSKGGGAELMALNGAKLLAERGHNVTICAPANKRSKIVQSELKQHGISVIEMHYKNYASFGDSKKLYQKIFDQIRDVANPTIKNFIRDNIQSDDLVIVHKMRTFSPLIFKYLAQRKCKFIYCMHDYELFSFNAKHIGRLIDKVYFFTFRRLFTQYLKHCYCPSNFMRDKILDLYNECNVNVLYNFVDFENKTNCSKEYELGFFGRLEHIKGIEHFCNAASMSKRRTAIVGQGSLYEDLKQKFESSKNLIFFGHVEQRESRNLMRQCSVVVIPSVWPEPFGLVAAEASYSNAYVLVSDQGALPEVLDAAGGKGKVISHSTILNQKEFCTVIDDIFNSNEIESNFAQTNEVFTKDMYYSNLIDVFYDI